MDHSSPFVSPGGTGLYDGRSNAETDGHKPGNPLPLDPATNPSWLFSRRERTTVTARHAANLSLAQDLSLTLSPRAQLSWACQTHVLFMVIPLVGVASARGSAKTVLPACVQIRATRGVIAIKRVKNCVADHRRRVSTLTVRDFSAGRSKR